MIDSLNARYVEVVQKYSNKTAVDTPDGKLSFSELDELSDKIGSFLLTSDGEACVLFMQSSCYYFASLIACMKTGKIAVPIDPTQTDSWLIRNKKRLSSSLCLTDSNLFSRAERIFGSEYCYSVELINDNCKSVEQPDIQNPILFPLHQVFTSGTSGIEKLITISRESVLIHTIESAEIYRYRPGLVVANLGRYTSSNIINGLWRVILTGACFVCFDLKKESFATVYSRIKDSDTRNLHGPTTVFCNFLRSLGSEADLSEIEHLIFGGEPLNPGFLNNVAKIFNPQCVVTLNYSSTETMLISAYTTSFCEAQNKSKMPVGTPVKSKSVKLLDEQGKEVNSGEAGEVVVSSKYVAMHISTDENDHSVSLNESDKLYERTYHTGDLARWNKERHLELLGRKDNMAKINGIRIDTKLIENQLIRIKEIEKATVVPVELVDGQKQLMACIVRIQKKMSNQEIVRMLSNDLHSSHIPPFFVDVDQIPTTPRGKTDHEKLQDICRKHFKNKLYDINVRDDYLADMDKCLLSLWSKVLNKPVADETNSFFAEGGDSLAINELIIAINSAYNLTLKSGWVLEYQTIQAQAEFLKSELSENQTETDSSSVEKNDLSEDEIRNLLGW